MDSILALDIKDIIVDTNNADKTLRYALGMDYTTLITRLYEAIPRHDFAITHDQMNELLGTYSALYGHYTYLFCRLLEYNSGKRYTPEIANTTDAIERMSKVVKHQYDSLSRKITLESDDRFRR